MSEGFEIIREISKRDNKSIQRRLIKLMEEVGELATEINLLDGDFHKKRTKEELHNNIIEEGVDSLICAVDILVKQGATEEEIVSIIKRKCAKWAQKDSVEPAEA